MPGLADAADDLPLERFFSAAHGAVEVQPDLQLPVRATLDDVLDVELSSPSRRATLHAHVQSVFVLAGSSGTNASARP
jgi:hypothetical protein